MVLLLLFACGVPETASLSVISTSDAPAAAESPVPTADPTGFADYTVDGAGGGDFTTIGDAIAAAQDGDWIEVAPGTYTEEVDFQGKTLWISSIGGSSVTTLDANGGRAITAEHGTGDGTALVGFTITDARDSGSGPIYVDLSALRLDDVVIESSQGAYGLIFASAGDVELQDVLIDASNSISYYAIYANRGAVVADKLTIKCSSRENGLYSGHGSFFLDESEIDCGSGYAINNVHTTGIVHRSRLVGDLYIESEDDHYYDANIFENAYIDGDLSAVYGKVVLRNSFVDGGLLSFNQVSFVEITSAILGHSNCPITWAYDPSLDLEAPAPALTVLYTDFFDVNAEHCDGVTTYSGVDGNLAVDPKFTDEAGGDYTLKGTSPLIDAGNPDPSWNDPDGTVNDIGLYGGPRSLGGAM